MKSTHHHRSLPLITCIGTLLISLTCATAQTDDYNIKIGDLLMDFSVNVAYAYNDNATAISENTPDIFDPTQIGPREDFILSFGANADLNWQISDNNTLGIALGMRWEDYQDLDYLDSQESFFSVDPESEIDFTVLVGPIEARVYDRFGYVVDGSSAARVIPVEAEPVIGGGGDEIIRGREIAVQVDRYAYWENELGLELLAVLNPIELSLGIRSYDLFPDDNEDNLVEQLNNDDLVNDRWEFTRRSELIIDLQAYYPLGRDNGVGLFFRFSDNNYKRDVLADSTGWQIGAVVDWALGDRTAITATVGYDYREFDEANTAVFASTGEFADITEGKNLFYAIEILNLLGESFNHKLSLTKQIGLGRVTNEQVTTTLAWDFLFEGIQKVDLTGGVQFINAQDSGPEQFAEEYDLFMATLGLAFQITDHLNSRIDYRYVDKDSNDDDRSFKQNYASVSLYYDF
jgi:hypothetical protein